MSFWEQFFKFMEKNAPGLLLAFGLGHKLGAGKQADLETKIQDMELANEIKENHEKVDKANANKSGSDIIDDAIAEGAKHTSSIKGV